jgi:XTP/dITP diphosphohydrolase
MTTNLPIRQLVLASRNAKKSQEIAGLLAPRGFELHSLKDFPEAPVVEETGSTFAENAALKATQVARSTGHWTLADDSGLMVDALDGAPGIYSARYAGESATDADNNRKLLQALRDVPPEKRGAQFVCHLAVSDPQGAVRVSVGGHCRGRIVEEDRGDQGFGYDPLFLILEYHRTFGQLGIAVKSCLSHRARAFARLLPALERVMS